MKDTVYLLLYKKSKLITVSYKKCKSTLKTYGTPGSGSGKEDSNLSYDSNLHEYKAEFFIFPS